MPNYCENIVEFTGTPERMEELKALITSDENIFDFNRITPEPKNQLTNDWHIEHWGTKWDARDVEITEDQPDTYALMFFTAWAEPLPIYQKLGELFPDITIRGQYYEPGNWSGGEFGSTTFGAIWTREWSDEELMDYSVEIDPDYYEQKIDELDISERDQIFIIECLPSFFRESLYNYSSALAKLLAVHMAEYGSKEELEETIQYIKKQYDFLHEADVKRYEAELVEELAELAKDGVVNND
jgi:hypothetical protein